MSKHNDLLQNPLYNQIILTCGSVEDFAERMGLSKQGAYKKIRNLKKWSVEDIEKARNALHINNSAEFTRIFFE